MASLPSKFNAAADALTAKLMVDISGCLAARVSRLVEKPEEWWEPSSFPTSARLLLAVADMTTAGEFDAVTVQEYERGQAMQGVIRGWSVQDDRTLLASQRVDDIRRVRNAIEACGAAHNFSDGWTIDWHGEARRLDNASNVPPYAAFEVTYVVTVWE
jgi:hypothetical protein